MLIQYAAAGILFRAWCNGVRDANRLLDARISIRALLACHRAVVRRDLATLFPHDPVCGNASCDPVLPHSASDGFNGMGTFQ